MGKWQLASMMVLRTLLVDWQYGTRQVYSEQRQWTADALRHALQEWVLSLVTV
jgi:hypothetical protein